MCFSAKVQNDPNKLAMRFGAQVDEPMFQLLLDDRKAGYKVRIPKAMEDALLVQGSADIRERIQDWRGDQAMKLEKELFTQKKRLNDAVRTLQTKTTKKAMEDQRIASNKISKAESDLDDLRRTEAKGRDSRIFPQWHASVVVEVEGKRLIRPMRYQCRLAGMPASSDFTKDRQMSGTYNARRDNLERFWRRQFGYTHGLMVVSTFYENVEGPDGKNQVLQFTPKDGSDMLVACLWSHWTDPADKEPDLLSFAAITDGPEPEVAAAGHDRTIINIKPEHVEAWLNPDPANLDALYAIFDDKQHPYYEHRLAA